MLQNLMELYPNVESAKKALRSVQSKKCRFAKQKSREDYDVVMTELLKNEQDLKELIKYYEPKKTFVTNYTKEDVEKLNYEETLRAIKSIQSRKCNTNFPELEEEYQKACRIEEMLLEHKKNIKPADETSIKKSRVQNLIKHIESSYALSNQEMIELLQRMIEDDEFLA